MVVVLGRLKAGGPLESEETGVFWLSQSLA